MDAAHKAREEEKAKLLARLAELLIEEQRAGGVYERTPHFSALENASHALGREVATASLQRAACEAAAAAQTSAACPQCGASCLVETRTRTLQGLDGPVQVLEVAAHCPACRRDFFPSAASPRAG